MVDYGKNKNESNPSPTKPKRTKFDLAQALRLKLMIQKNVKQYWLKQPDWIDEIEDFEKYFTEREGIKLDFVRRERIRRGGK